MGFSLGTVYCPDVLLSNFTTLLAENGVFGGFCMIEGCFEGATRGPIVLDTVVETNKPLLDDVHCLIQSQSDFTTS